ncbi:MAG TPA: DUF6350 family protein [Jiangellaceae bacterium]|nr:DUF6350 family protein [Jiangellaceae bacterium]
MTDLLSRPFLRRTEPAWGSTVPWLAGVLAAAWALVAGLAIAALPAILVWIDEGASAPVGDPVRVGVQIWLAGHRAGLQIGDADVQFAPLGMTVVAILLLYRAARWAAHTAGVSTLRKAVLVVLPAVGLYAVGAWGLAMWSMTMSVSVDPLVASVWAGLTAAVGTGVGVVHEADLGGRLTARLPAWAVPVLGGAAVAVAGLLAVGALLVAISAIAHSDRIAAVAEALDPDLPGMLALAMAGAALVPNAVVWAASYALGPGFALGAGTSVAPGAVELGIVPALPALAAVPADAPGPWGWLVLAGPIGVGVLTGAGIRRISASGRAGMVGEAFGAAVTAALLMAGLATLSGGSVGAARMSVVGPVPWEPALATFLVVGIPAVMVAALRGRRA